MSASNERFRGYIYGRPGYVRYEVSQVDGLHKRPHLWRVAPDGITHNTAASFASREETEAFMAWLDRLMTMEWRTRQ